ncbi:ATP-dependent RNA helicase DEAH11, chloroplastic-like [Wolffia australiana]
MAERGGRPSNRASLQRPFSHAPFSVVLERNRRRGHRRFAEESSSAALKNLIAGSPVSPRRIDCRTSHDLACKLFFSSRADALEAAIYFWGLYLEGAHDLRVRLDSNSPVNRGEEDSRIRCLFAEHARSLLSCESARLYDRKIDDLTGAIKKLSISKIKRAPLAEFEERMARRRSMEEEGDLLRMKQGEFRAGVFSILGLLGESIAEKGQGGGVYEADGKLDWDQLHCLLVRERRRLEEGLPIYAYRRKILSLIACNQVMMLEGETGSGKSTQVVQFLADSWLDGPGTIICTQPRKIAAATLAKRVSEESHGCYLDDLASSYLTYSPGHAFKSRVVFTTDHCLLQHLMNDPSLTGVSHVIVDEAHERNLNTDLVLALVKSLLLRRLDIRFIVMSATADCHKLSNYLFGCVTLSVAGRSFPVELKYVPAEANVEQTASGLSDCAAEVVKMVSTIHQSEGDGGVLAFLTSQMEVEWACEHFHGRHAVALPLHGKLSQEDQRRVFENLPGKRKVIFCTNIAETSLTIPGIKFVVDSGLVKECWFEPRSGMNMLRVRRISQSSAKQRAGRAGRTEPGKCFRLYTESEFQSMDPYPQPEICKVHLGMAVLKIISLGVHNMMEFDFIDAPNSNSIDAAVQNLVQLGAVVQCRGDGGEGGEQQLKLTEMGRCLIKLGIEPRLGKMILDCHAHGLTKEGLVLAAVMANASSIFCRVGSDDEKLRADCLKVPFCHRDGDLFTLLSVYREWELAEEGQNQWCWQNSVNAKSMRRCQETVTELDACLFDEFNFVVPTYWKWETSGSAEYSRLLKRVILSSLGQNLAAFSGCDKLGYKVALSGLQLPLHPSCSLLVFGEMPAWVVFGEILSLAKQYLVCVTAVDLGVATQMDPPLPFNPGHLAGDLMKRSTIIDISRTVLRRLCSRASGNIKSLCARAQKACADDRIRIEVDFEAREIQLLSSPSDADQVCTIVNDALDCLTRYVRTECTFKSLFRPATRGFSAPVALFGAGADIRHLELDGRLLELEISHPEAKFLSELDILMAVDGHISGVAGVRRYVDDPRLWGNILFLCPEDVETATEALTAVKIRGALLKVRAVATRLASFSGDGSPSMVTAKIFWPRKPCRGRAQVHCTPGTAELVAGNLDGVVIGGRVVIADVSPVISDCVIVGGLGEEAIEEEVYAAVAGETAAMSIVRVHVFRGGLVLEPPANALEEAILREVAPFVSRKGVRVQILDPGAPQNSLTRALVSFDGKMHQEAASALSHLVGRALPICRPWQKIRCQQLFSSSLVCPPAVFPTIKSQLLSLIQRFNCLPGFKVVLEEMESGVHRVKMFANCTKMIADMRRPLEELVKGRVVELAVVAAQQIRSRDGAAAARSVGWETRTYILHDKRSGGIRIFGATDDVATAERRLIAALLSLREQAQLKVSLRGGGRPPDLVKRLVDQFGPDLRGLQDEVPGATFLLDVRRHVLHIRGDMDHRRKVEEIIQPQDGNAECCPICLCQLEEPFQLEGCGHCFCRGCLAEQLESTIRNREGFPVCCLAEEGQCREPFLLQDLRDLVGATKLEELFWAALAAHVAGSCGEFRFCPSPDCPGIYRAATTGTTVPYTCGACGAETCRRCHVEYHPWLSCEMYREIKEDPDVSVEEWRRGKNNVKRCPACGHVIEKTEGCSHVECLCGCHICWDCLLTFSSSEDCYAHLRAIHLDIM